MEPEDIAGYIDNLRGRFAELEERMADPAIYARGAEFRSVSQEHRKLGALLQKNSKAGGKPSSELADNREMADRRGGRRNGATFSPRTSRRSKKSRRSSRKRFRSPCCRPIRMTPKTSSSRSNRPQAATKPPSSRGSFSALICTLPKNRVGRLRFSTSPTRISAASRTCRFRSPDAMSFR